MSDDSPDTEATRVESVRNRKPTIYDVAKHLGLNPSTVSRALNNPGRVNQVTEAKIRAAANELGYRTNPFARALQTGKTGTFAVILSDITNPVHFDLIRGAEQVAARNGLTLVLAETQGSPDAERATIARLQRSVDGILVVASRLDADSLRAIAAETPVVAANHAADGIPSVFADMRTGLIEAVEHLHGLGHRSLAYLGGLNAWIDAARWDLLLGEAESRGMSIVEIEADSATVAGGAGSLRRVLASGVTAVVAYNDLVAHGLLLASRSATVDVPGRLSVVGFDDIFSAELSVPALTTVRSPLRQIGTVAMNRLITGAFPGTESERVALATTLVVRESSGPPPDS
ncbi:LacI family DNA-binding transcriptional regulator [Microbacterium sp. P5_E9]